MTDLAVQEFLEGLLDMHLADAKAAQVDRPLLLAAAAVALLGTYPLLAEHAVSLGYVQQLLDLFAACTGPSPGTKPHAAILAHQPGTRHAAQQLRQ